MCMRHKIGRNAIPLKTPLAGREVSWEGLLYGRYKE